MRVPADADRKAAIALIRGRFGYFAIGLGEAGIRFRCGDAGGAQFVRESRPAFVSIAKVL